MDSEHEDLLYELIASDAGLVPESYFEDAWRDSEYENMIEQLIAEVREYGKRMQRTRGEFEAWLAEQYFVDLCGKSNCECGWTP